MVLQSPIRRCGEHVKLPVPVRVDEVDPGGIVLDRYHSQRVLRRIFRVHRRRARAVVAKVRDVAVAVADEQVVHAVLVSVVENRLDVG